MPKKGTPVLFRHKQTEYNKLYYLIGLHDATLTQEAQARVVGTEVVGR